MLNFQAYNSSRYRQTTIILADGPPFTQPRATPWDEWTTSRSLRPNGPTVRYNLEPLVCWTECAFATTQPRANCPGLGEPMPLRGKTDVGAAVELPPQRFISACAKRKPATRSSPWPA